MGKFIKYLVLLLLFGGCHLKYEECYRCSGLGVEAACGRNGKRWNEPIHCTKCKGIGWIERRKPLLKKKPIPWY